MATEMVTTEKLGKCLKCDEQLVEVNGKVSGGRHGVQCFAGGFGPHTAPWKVSTQERTETVDGRLVLVRQCGYCWAEYFEPKAHRSYFCSPECSKRNSVWNSWVRDTNHAAVHGDVNRPVKVGPMLPPAGKSLDQMSRFGRLFELGAVA